MCSPNPRRAITSDEIERFRRDGVVMLSGMFERSWVDLLRSGLERHLITPTARARVWDRDDAGRTMFWDSMAWQDVPEYEQFVRQSPAAAIAGQLLGAKRINFFFDAVFVRSAGTQFETPWHQDEPYWSVKGHQTCTVWMPLVRVQAKNALAFVPGSHLGEVVFDQYDFGSLNPDAKAGVDRSDFSAIAEADVPDISANPAAFGVVSWDMDPGDCAVFNSRILHGGSGVLGPKDDLPVFTSKWLGDDVRVAFRDEGMDPDFSDIMRSHGLSVGDRPVAPPFPEVWARADGL
ncbi:MAG: phytanoyl-CoA dioxygenase family protein [Acidimicrobiales bacterium]